MLSCSPFRRKAIDDNPTPLRCGDCVSNEPMTTDKEILETTFYVRFAETDLMGIVHHSQYVVWMEEGRSDFMRRKGFTFDQWEAANIGFAVSEMNLRYHAPARYGERVTVRTWIESLRSRQIIFEYEIVNADSLQELV